MRGRTRAAFWGAVLEAPDARALAEFYAGLLGWTIAKTEPGWAAVSPPSGVAYLGFQTSPEYVPPVWPAVDGAQQMMMHLDIEVDDLDAAVADAIAAGATLAGHQPQDDVRVLLDPAGHPFCLYLDR
jgi:catechol 2,3-dioxygenase-like lactoylglutathione lyase family enzyme